MTIGPASMKGIERTNTMVTRNLGRQIGPPKRDSYMIDVDRGRNCYVCGGFGYLARNCKNSGVGNRIGEERRLEYRHRRMIEEENKNTNNLNGD